MCSSPCHHRLTVNHKVPLNFGKLSSIVTDFFYFSKTKCISICMCKSKWWDFISLKTVCSFAIAVALSPSLSVCLFCGNPHTTSPMERRWNLFHFIYVCMYVWMNGREEFWSATNILFPYFVWNGRFVDWLHKWMRMSIKWEMYIKKYTVKQRAEWISVFCITVEYMLKQAYRKKAPSKITYCIGEREKKTQIQMLVKDGNGNEKSDHHTYRESEEHYENNAIL